MLGLVNGVSRLAEKFFDTSVQMIRNIPHLAMIPLVILWFGIGEQAKIFLVALGVLCTALGLGMAWVLSPRGSSGNGVWRTVVNALPDASPLVAGSIFSMVYGDGGHFGLWSAGSGTGAMAATILAAVFISVPVAARALMDTRSAEETMKKRRRPGFSVPRSGRFSGRCSCRKSDGRFLTEASCLRAG